MTLPDGNTMPAYPVSGFKNKIINGDFRISQRYGTVAQAVDSSAAKYVIDRWAGRVIISASSGTMTVQQISDANSYFARLAKTAGTSVGAICIAQAFETANSYQLQNKVVTISFMARKGATFNGLSAPYVVITTGTGTDQSAESMISGAWTGSAVQQGAANGSALTTSWQPYTFTTTALSASTMQVGMYISTGEFSAATGDATNYLDIRDVQFEVSSVATPFETRPYGVELALCQRYYYRVSPAAVAKLLNTAGGNASTSIHWGVFTFPVIMRTAPSAIEQSGIANNYMVNSRNVNTVATGVPTHSSSTTATAAYFTVATGATMTAGDSALLFTDTTNGATAYLGWSAEL
jgi:hypothetical protein